jgi:LPS-assembly lipoprotein
MSLFRVVLILPLLLTACGFHVRGAANLPPEISVVYIDSVNRYSEFYQALVTEIRGSRLTLADNSEKADTVIRVSQDISGRRVLSVSARNVPTEFEVSYTVRFSVFMEGEEVLTPKQLVRIREYTYDETLVLGKAREEEVLRRAIAADLVGMVIQHLSAIS